MTANKSEEQLVEDIHGLARENEELKKRIGVLENEKELLKTVGLFKNMAQEIAARQAAGGLCGLETLILTGLDRVWSMFSSLDNLRLADKHEMASAIYAAQAVIAVRVARRINPEVWGQPQKAEKADKEVTEHEQSERQVGQPGKGQDPVEGSTGQDGRPDAG